MSSPEPSSDTPQGATDQTAVAQDQAAGAATQQNQVRSLASALTVSDPTQYALVTKGKVTNVVNPGTPPTISIQLAGDTSTTIDNVRFIDSYSPVVNDTVLIVKQGSELFALGQMNDASSVSQNGWTAPTLSGIFTTYSNDPVLYRMVNEHGTNKIQLRGRINIGGSISTTQTLFTLPTGMRPLFDHSPVLIAQDDAGGNAVGQITPMANGNINFSAYLSRGTISATQHGNLTTSYYNVDHYHIGPWGSLGGSGGCQTCRCNPGGGEIIGVLGGSVQDGGTSTTHRHTTDSATHTHNIQTTSPTWVSFNGIEYFL